VPGHAALAEGTREEPIGAPVTEPRVVRGEGTDPEGEAVLADSVGVALLVVLDTLTPAERLAFVLHDLFALPFDEIGSIVGRTPAGLVSAKWWRRF
jgi:RNA polymerase sigma-70 factor (ECF subfamily)